MSSNLQIPYTPPVIVYVTTRVVLAMTPAEDDASSWYDSERPLAFSFVMPVMTSTAVVLSATRPALLAPAGAPRLAERVTPAGIALPMLAVILAVLWLVVTAQVLPEDVTLVGGLPGTAAVTAIVGEPVT